MQPQNISPEELAELDDLANIELKISDQLSTIITAAGIKAMLSQPMKRSDLIGCLVKAGLVRKSVPVEGHSKSAEQNFYLMAGMSEQYSMISEGGFPVFPSMKVMDLVWYHV